MRVYHIRSKRSLHEVVCSNGRVSPTGSGLYVSTVPDAPFPWIRYSNGDSVTISASTCRCGFSGLDLHFRERRLHVKIGTGPIINCDELLNFYGRRSESGRAVILFGRVDSGDFSHRLVVFIERSVPEPVEIEGEWKNVMWVGSGGCDQTYARNIHVIAVPVGRIPEPRFSKPGTLINLEVSDGGYLGKVLRGLVCEVTHERLTNSRDQDRLRWQRM